MAEAEKATEQKPLMDAVSSTDKEYLELPGGHISLIAGRGASTHCWPKVAAWLAARGHWTQSFHAAGYAHLALAAAGLWLALPAPDRETTRVAEPARGPVFSRALVPFALASFGYVGIESALTVFAVPYASQGHGLPVARGLASITAFWMGLFGGRLIPLAAA